MALDFSFPCTIGSGLAVAPASAVVSSLSLLFPQRLQLEATKGLLSGLAQVGPCGNEMAEKPGVMMIDWERVSDLRSEIGDEGFAEVEEIFLEETDDVIARLSAGPSEVQIGKDMHFLKGSAWNLGFAAFGVLCQSGERRAAQGQAATVDMAAVLASYAASKDCFLAGLAKLTAGQTPDAA